MSTFPIAVDLEVTNRCNAKCHFCPRDQTPHQGLMSQEVFEAAFAAALAAPEDIRVNLCGLGEPLLNPKTPRFARAVTDAGIDCGMTSNGSLLDERRAHAVLDAGVSSIYLNVGESGEDYEAVYELPFEPTLRNVERFVELAEGRCEITVVLVNHRRDEDHLDTMRAFWEERGITHFARHDIINRGGALFVDDMEASSSVELARAEALLADADPEAPALCSVPFTTMFVGYDGQYYLCCSDWRKQAPLGSVFDTSFLEIAERKFHHVTTREPVCASCNLDPRNQLVDDVRAHDAGEIDAAELAGRAAEIVEVSTRIADGMERLRTPAAGTGRRLVRKLIPVSTR